MRNPFYAFIAFLIVEALVALGFLNREQAPLATTELENVVFFFVLAITGLAGFHKYIDSHKHQVNKDTEVQKENIAATTTIKRFDPPMEVFTENVDSGTPPYPATQNEHFSRAFTPSQ